MRPGSGVHRVPVACPSGTESSEELLHQARPSDRRRLLPVARRSGPTGGGYRGFAHPESTARSTEAFSTQW